VLQRDDRQMTDGRATEFSECECEFMFAKKRNILSVTFGICIDP